MKVNHLVSVSLITYNQKNFIEEAINGIIKQKTNFYFDIIIGDDCSTDGTVELLKQYASQNSNIKLILHKQRNTGIPGKVNFLSTIEASQGKYIALCDGDDYWTDPYKLQKQVDILEANPQYAGSFHETEVVIDNEVVNNRLYGRNANELVSAKDTFSIYSVFHVSSFIFRKKHVKIPNWFHQVISGDLAVFSIISAGGEIIKVPEKMSVYRIHDLGITNTNFVTDTYHQKRIFLMRCLNEFHNYKYENEARKTIDYHKKELIEKQINPATEPDAFLNPPFTEENLDRYYVRKSILEALSLSLTEFSGRFLDVACGKMPYREHILTNSLVKDYVGLDIESALQYDADIKADFSWDGITMPFDDASFESSMATEVLEHCPEPEIVLKEVHRVLKPNGIFFFTVPFLWNLHEVPHDEYRYTPWALERHLKNSGFSHIEIKALGGWHASLAQMLGLWVRRSQMTDKKKKVFSKLLKPLIKQLIKRDIRPESFGEGTMMTGLYGIAIK